jgi:putative ABC transport system permease protein
MTQGVLTASLENISEKHFKKNYTFQMPTETFVNRLSVQIIFVVGIITLLISWLNYINFLNFQHIKRLKEIGIKKINGSSKIRLIFSLLTESFLMIALPILIFKTVRLNTQCLAQYLVINTIPNANWRVLC